MNTLFFLIIILSINVIIGSAVCAFLDTKDEVFYRWYKNDPTQVLHFAILSLWPVMAFFMIRYRIKNAIKNKHNSA